MLIESIIDESSKVFQKLKQPSFMAREFAQSDKAIQQKLDISVTNNPVLRKEDVKLTSSCAMHQVKKSNINHASILTGS